MRNRILAALAAVYIFWGGTYLAIRFAVETIPPFMMAGMRFTVAGTILYAWARRGGAKRPTLIEWRSAIIIGITLLVISNGGVTWSEQRVPSGITALLVATVPMWIVLFDWLRKGGVRPSRGIIAGLLIGFAGTALLIGTDQLLGNRSIDLVGVGVLTCCCFSWTAGSLYSRHATLPSSPFQSAAMEMIAGGVVLLIVSFVSGEMTRFDPSLVSTRSIVSMLYLIVFGSIIGFTAYAWLFRTTSSSKVAIYAYVNPAIAIFLGWAFAGEQLTSHTFFAAGMIIFAVVLIITSQSSGTPRPQSQTNPDTTPSIRLAGKEQEAEPA